MERFRTINPRRMAIFAGIMAVVVVALAIWMRDVVREVIVLPISYILYVAGIVIDATPQIFFWLVSILLAFWLAYRSLSHRRKPVPSGNAATSRDETPSPAGRTSFWTIKDYYLRRYRSNYYQSSFHQSLGRLLVEALAHRYRLTTNQVEDRLRHDELDLPEDVREYARYCLARPETGRMFTLAQFWEDFLESLRIKLRLKSSKININSPSVRASQKVDIVIRFMEDELEVPYEHPSQPGR